MGGQGKNAQLKLFPDTSDSVLEDDQVAQDSETERHIFRKQLGSTEQLAFYHTRPSKRSFPSVPAILLSLCTVPFSFSP